MSKLKTEYLSLEDIRISYTQHGDGSNLLLLHGNSGGKEFFNRYQTDFFGHFHSIALDSRGHGKSRSKDVKLSYEQQSLDVLNFCKSLGSQKHP